MVAEFKSLNPSCPRPPLESSSNFSNIDRDNYSSTGHPEVSDTFKSRFFDSEPSPRVSSRDTGRPEENGCTATDTR